MFHSIAIKLLCGLQSDILHHRVEKTCLLASTAVFCMRGKWLLNIPHVPYPNQPCIPSETHLSMAVVYLLHWKTTINKPVYCLNSTMSTAVMKLTLWLKSIMSCISSQTIFSQIFLLSWMDLPKFMCNSKDRCTSTTWCCDTSTASVLKIHLFQLKGRY